MTPKPSEPKSVRELLADAVNSAIESGRTSAKKLVDSGAVTNGPLARIRHTSTNVGIDSLERIARELGREPWALIHPDYQASSDPNARSLSAEAHELGRALDAISDGAARQHALALALRILHLTASAMPQGLKQTANPDLR